MSLDAHHFLTISVPYFVNALIGYTLQIMQPPWYWHIAALQGLHPRRLLAGLCSSPPQQNSAGRSQTGPVWHQPCQVQQVLLQLGLLLKSTNECRVFDENFWRVHTTPGGCTWNMSDVHLASWRKVWSGNSPQHSQFEELVKKGPLWTTFVHEV